MSEFSAERIEAFWAKVDKGDGCWRWRPIRPDAVYRHGRFWTGLQSVPAHVFAWQLENGPIPDGVLVCHKCDNPPCVRPSHLFLGTHADNAKDRNRKGRNFDNRGERHGLAKLTTEQAVAIIESAKTKSQTEVASEYGIYPSTVSRIVSGQRWPHLAREG